ncbi:MAG TPA: DUF5335 family protein [Jatrophihabitans sp.]|nr:DUF5335 family protein [Jatrophihabitans sp.]
MTDTSTDREAWAEELDRLTDDHEGDQVVIEILDQEFGDNEEAERVPFAYANYDRKDDVVIIAVGGRSGRYPVTLRHIIDDPVEVDVTDDAIRVVSEDGTTTIVAFVSDES